MLTQKNKWDDKPLTYADIALAQASKFPPDLDLKKQFRMLASLGYIKQEELDGIIYITLL